MKPYLPNMLPVESLGWEKLIPLIGKANAALARYDGVLRGIINPAVLLTPLTTQEAVLSSKIEGTIATLEEVLEYEASPDDKTEKSVDIKEIINYRQAMRFAVEELEDHPISFNLIRKIHYGLMDSVRGRNKARGEFRQTQNWLGKPGATIKEATYVPPPPDTLIELLSNLEKYINSDELDTLVQIAIIHAQFELIHPFLDGNGRVGRILIPLFLFKQDILSMPTFYISAYLEKHRDVYYERLKDISLNNKWGEWLVFFLTAVIEQANNNLSKAEAILDLYEETKQGIGQLIRSQFSIQAIDAIFEAPVFNTTGFIKRSGIPKASAMRILKNLTQNKTLKIIRESSGRKPSVMAFKRLLDIVQ